MEINDSIAAADRAKEFIRKIYEAEGITKIFLEGVEFDDASGVWDVRISFNRPWDDKKSVLANFAEGGNARAYKSVKLRKTDGEIISLMAINYASQKT